MKAKFRNLVLILALSASVCAFATACEFGKTSEISSSSASSEEVTDLFALDAKSLELDLYEKYDLGYTAQDISGTVAWTSSAPSVVSVENGSLEAKTAGTAVVTATLGEYSDECVVKVVDNGSIPSLYITEEISVAKGSTTSAEISVLWKGKVLNVPLSCEFESGDASAASVSISNGKLVAEGLDYGSAKYLLTAQTHGRTLAKTFEVKCLDGSVVVVVENANPTVGGWVADVALCDNENGLPISYEPQVSVYEKNVKVENATFTWTLETGNYFREDGGVYYADYLGSQVLKGSYKGNEIVITLKSVRPDFVRTDKILVEMVEGVQAPKNLEGTVDGYTINGVNVFESYDASTDRITFKQTSLCDPAKMGEKAEIVVQTNRARYFYTGSVYTNVITTEAELNRWVEDAKATTTGTNASGYFVLGNDIVCTGEYKAQETYTFGASATDGFQGIFDGRGYTIKNINVTGDMCGFMPMIGQEGVVCNIVFENAAVSGNGGFIAAHLRGMLYNLYIDISILDNDDVATGSFKGDRRYHRSAIASQCEGSTVIRDCAVVYRTTVGEDKTTGHPFRYLYGKVTGFYMIGHTAYASFEDELQFGNSAKTNFGTYATRAAMIADLETWNKDGHIWNESFWTTDADGIPVPVKKA